jgi:ClpP class serine protease
MKILLTFLFTMLFAFSVAAQPENLLSLLSAQKSNVMVLDKDIAIITIHDVIDEEMGDAVTEAVKQINEHPAETKGVFLIVDTGGGNADDSALIYEELSKLKVPVVAWCNRSCMSGGVWAMMATSVKFSAVRSFTHGGSVGVISIYGLCDKNCPDMFKSGIFKGTSSDKNSVRSVEEKAYLQSITDGLAAAFYNVVAKARPNITPANWVLIKQARIFYGQAIVDIGLADAVMSREQAMAKLRSLI